MRAVSSVLAVSFLSVFAVPESAAQPAHLWSHGYGSTGFDIGHAVAADDDDNVFATGYFNGTVDFGGGNLTSAGADDVFLLKLDPAGSHLWSRKFGSTGFDDGYAVVTDGLGNVIVAGGFAGTVDFGGGNLMSAGGADIFVAKYDAAGAHVWSKRFGSTLGDYAFGLAVDGSNNVVVTGVFRGTVDFGGGGLVSLGFDDIFVAKYDAAGAHQWSARNGGTLFDRGNAICVDSFGSVFVVGQFQGTVSGQVASGTNAFLTKYNSAGTFQWFFGYGGAGGDIATGVTVSGGGGVYLTGHFEGSAVFGGAALVSSGGSDIVLAKYNSAGTHQWSMRFGDTANDEGRGVVADGDGNVIMTGEFRGAINFGGGTFAAAMSDIFAARYDATGAHQWSEVFGAELEDGGNDVAVDASNNIALAGAFRGTVEFGGGGLTSNGETDVFLIEYGGGTTGAGDTPASRGVSVASYPNPFNPRTAVTYAVPSTGPVTVAIFDAAGRRVATLVDGERRNAGSYRVDWDGRTDAGKPVSSGVYFARVGQSGATASTKLVLLK